MELELSQKKALILKKGNRDVDIIPYRSRQPITNLVSNSLKFSSPDMPPVISIAIGIVDNNVLHKSLIAGIEYCHICLEDNGIWFEQQYAEKISELFQRLHGVAKYTGTGIGLAVVKKIIDNHNGFICASSILNKGEKFDIYPDFTKRVKGKTKKFM